MKTLKDPTLAVAATFILSILAFMQHLSLGYVPWVPHHPILLYIHSASLGSSIAIAWYIWRTRRFEKRGNSFFIAFTASGVLLTMTLLAVNVIGTFFSSETIDWIIAYHPGEIYSYICANVYLWVCYFTNLRYFWPTAKRKTLVFKRGWDVGTKKFTINFFEVDKYTLGPGWH